MQLINQRPNLLGWRLCGVTNGMGQTKENRVVGVYFVNFDLIYYSF